MISKISTLKIYLRLLFIAVAALLIFTNSVQLTKQIGKNHRLRKFFPYPYHGYKFSGLTEILKGVQFAGYCTDKNLDVNEPAMQFSQAQYELAPVVLDLNNTAHEFIFFDYLDQAAAQKKIEEIQAIPLKKNKYGIILARKAHQE